MPLKNLEYWIWAQMGAELVLIILCLLLFYCHWSRGRKDGLVREDTRFFREELSRLKELLTGLENRQGNCETMLRQVELSAFPGPDRRNGLRSQGEGLSPQTAPREQGVSLRSQVESLHRQGVGQEDIARRLQINPAEVKVALDLSQMRTRKI